MDYIRGMFLNIRVMDILDILIVAVVLYKLFKLISETRAEQLTKGLILLFVFAYVSKKIRLNAVSWLLENSLKAGLVAIIIVFQPELRRGLEYIGRTGFLSKSIVEVKGEAIINAIDEIVEACASLARQKIGALIVLERKTGLNEVVETGTVINGAVSSNLLINIFIPNSPLHDGAVIIKEDRIKAAACFLPLTDNQNLTKDLGTRHRAALGISERSDCLSVVVSEETGAISVAEKGNITRHLDQQTLRQILINMYETHDKPTYLLFKWRKKNEQNKEKGTDA